MARGIDTCEGCGFAFHDCKCGKYTEYDKKHLAAMTDMEKIEVATRKAVATVELVKLNALLEVYEEWMSPERFVVLAQIETLEKYLRG